jgi:hypothetical protein
MAGPGSGVCCRRQSRAAGPCSGCAPSHSPSTLLISTHPPARSEEERGKLQRSMGLKMEQLKVCVWRGRGLHFYLLCGVRRCLRAQPCGAVPRYTAPLLSPISHPCLSPLCCAGGSEAAGHAARVMPRAAGWLGWCSPPAAVPMPLLTCLLAPLLPRSPFPFPAALPLSLPSLQLSS